MRTQMLIILLACPAWSVFARQIQGTITMSQNDMISSKQTDSYFWRLGPNEKSKPPFEPPIIVLEKKDSTNTHPTSVTTHTLTIKGFAIEPSFINISPNDKVIFENKGLRPYSCYAEGPNAFQFAELKPEETIEQKLLTEDRLKVHCHLYPFMTATILITPTTLVTRADEKGNFTFKGLRTGNYQLKAYVNGSWRWKRDIQVLAYGTVRVKLGSPVEQAKPVVTKAPSAKIQKPAVQKKKNDLKAKLTPAKTPSIKPPHTIDTPPDTKPAVTKQKITSIKKRDDRPKNYQGQKPKKNKPVSTMKKERKKPSARESAPNKGFTEPSFDDIEPEIEIEEE